MKLNITLFYHFFIPIVGYFFILSTTFLGNSSLVNLSSGSSASFFDWRIALDRQNQQRDSNRSSELNFFPLLAFLLKLLHNTGGSGLADVKLSLQIRCRYLRMLLSKLSGRPKEWVLGVAFTFVDSYYWSNDINF